MMEVTNEMLYAAVRQAVKEGILPRYGTEEQYMSHYRGMKMILEAAIAKAKADVASGDEGHGQE